ncbi:choice-of-anchor L domain-containing protein [Luteirhabdus pelagi]|uniref:choice-of-anchor L domain-containing protein n=1 Tax=Luteirhabdus pelagi TaxID=2792783 RepID=UPI001939D71F|nr:choice-of-anchor L domain-containing protein [Luteirhabdus pelagi]
MKRLLFLSAILLSSCGLFAQITVDGSLTPQQLVDDILISNTCVTTSNHIAITGTDFGNVNGLAAFDANGTDFPFASGIVLASGNVNDAPGPNTSINSTSPGWPGDTDLETYTTATNTNDATILQFDFVPNIDELSFNFIMASEEYEEGFECTFSDAFAFILTDQVTGNVQNLAVLPGTNIPIEVTNIRPEVIGQCPAVNEEFFDRYNFQPVANPTVNSIPAEDSPINYNGQTVVLTAMGPVVPGNPYTIKLVVADETDSALDMAVFLEAGSFNIGDVDIANDILGTVVGCDVTEVNLEAEITGIPISEANIQWSFNGVPIPGATDPNILVDQEGEYTITISTADCSVSDSVIVNFSITPEIDLGSDIESCLLPSEGIEIDASPTNVDPADAVYEWFLDGVLIPGETGPTITPTQTGTYVVTVENEGCIATEEIVITPIAFETDLGDDISSCFISPEILTAILTVYDPADATFQWFLDGTEITGETNQTLDATQAGTYEVIVSVGDCQASDIIVIDQSNDIDIELGDDIETCAVDPLLLDASPTNYDVADASFEWTLDGNIIAGETAPTLSVQQEGTYEVTVTVGSCETTDTITITAANDIAVELGDEIVSCLVQAVTLDATPDNYDVADASFEWTLDGTIISGETDPTLAVTESGVYEVTVTVGICSTTDTITITPANDIEIELGDDVESCFLDPVVLDASPSNYDVSVAEFEWTLNGTVIDGAEDATLEATEPGVYEVTVTIGECVATDSITLTLGSFSVTLGADFDSCFESAEILFADVNGIDPENATFEWVLDGTVLTDENNQSLEAFGAGTYQVNVTAGSCTASDEIVLSINQDLQVTIQQDDFQTCPNVPTIIEASSNDSDATYQWFENGVLIPDATSSTLEVSLISTEVGSVEYTVQVVKGSCQAEDDVTISLYDNADCVITQGLSPFGSPGQNDKFDLEFLADRTGIESFTVYNRHGLLVYEKSNYVNEWRGQSKDNKKMPTGTYYYVILFDGEDPVYGTEKSGWVYINQDEN